MPKRYAALLKRFGGSLKNPMQSTRLITLITTTFNCLEHLDGYLNAMNALDPAAFDWIVVDAGSTDGTRQRLDQMQSHFSFYASERDAGFYYGLNKAVAQVKTPYYMVFGADDRPSPTLLEDVGAVSNGYAALLLGAVRIMPSGIIKSPGPRWIHPVVWGRAVSHHSVGTVIRTSLHGEYGFYDTDYRLVADGAFLKKVLASDEPVIRTDRIFGDFMTGGMSSQLTLRSILESFMLQVRSGSNFPLQLFLMTLRLTKGWLSGSFRPVQKK